MIRDSPLFVYIKILTKVQFAEKRDDEMGSHDASVQMLGYLYQVRYALYLLMKCEDPSHRISIEKFDDVSFDSDGDAKQRIQLKHHTNKGDLTNASADLWRTIKVWIDAIQNDPSLLVNTDFLIITTASVPENSIAYMLQANESKRAYDVLKTIAEAGGNQTNEKYYDAFLRFPKETMIRLLQQVHIIDKASKIDDVESELRRELRLASPPAHEDDILQQVEGWWYEQCIKALCSAQPYIMTLHQLREKIFYIAHQYGNDNLPIEYWNIDPVEEGDLNEEERIFLEQLRLLRYGSNKLQIAINDYYRAYKERSSWLRKGLLYPNDLDDYERRLVDEWKHAFVNMQEDLALYETPDEIEKIQAGRKLNQTIEARNYPIRPRVDEPYVMRGTYHGLANGLKIGWHVDFIDRLKHLLERA